MNVTHGNGKAEGGVVTLEFLLLFPFIVAILYAAGYYSVLFSWQYRMQSVVDGAVASGMYLDRSRFPEQQLGTQVRTRAYSALTELVQDLPPSVQERLELSADNCVTETVSAQSIVVVRCELTMPQAALQAVLPSLTFGFLGRFPPAPSNGIRASAQVAF
ncbi:hypothetical protein A167_00071 [Alcanivorax sp. S71-1-4]|uniref:hypothetical protein n=1 Tax=Alcanivorax sp. S71-1-4 TaxID=1177159 RepID=UPI001358DA8B|nr:hypothetical protein [Alcanivorax sp. S71-1-4]KAF0811039.1 hypothetical protein A167_00071 [Alcanivorax sp. S71-1-4]